jgi:hypothetical protein
MPVIKQKSLKPATTIPEAAGILAYNGSGVDIAANDLVYIAAGLQGSALKIAGASASLDERGGKVPVFVAKHAIPQNERGVILPWLIITGVDTSGVTAAGDAVYLSDATGAWIPTKVGGTVARMVGVCLTKHASTGVVWLCPNNFSYGTD